MKVNLNQYAQEVNEWAETKGWNDKEVPFPEFIALCHSELSEALESFREGYQPAEAFLMSGKPEGIPSELADLLIRVFHYCGRNNIDIDEAYVVKMAYNHQRRYRHGGKVI